MDVSEKKFEQWFRSIETGDDDKWELPAYKSPEWNAYLLRRQLALGAWQASREALEVKLPKVCAFNLCELLDKKEVIEAIRAAGIKVKE
ncbi:hypothetical protein [Enterobacter sp. UPMP2052]